MICVFKTNNWAGNYDIDDRGWLLIGKQYIHNYPPQRRHSPAIKPYSSPQRTTAQPLLFAGEIKWSIVRNHANPHVIIICRDWTGIDCTGQENHRLGFDFRFMQGLHLPLQICYSTLKPLIKALLAVYDEDEVACPSICTLLAKDLWTQLKVYVCRCITSLWMVEIIRIVSWSVSCILRNCCESFSFGHRDDIARRWYSAGPWFRQRFASQVARDYRNETVFVYTGFSTKTIQSCLGRTDWLGL